VSRLDGYNCAEHAHVFALWAAARAIQRRAKGAKSKRLSKAFAAAGLRAEFQTAEQSEWDAVSFDAEHKRWCEQFQRSAAPAVALSFGQAAKFIAIYLKVVHVLRMPQSSFVKCVHPPVDSELLKAVPEAHLEAVGLDHSSAWTKFDFESYSAAIVALRAWMPDLEEFWRIEAFWNPVDA
jgi:hypothetical protein